MHMHMRIHIYMHMHIHMQPEHVAFLNTLKGQLASSWFNGMLEPTRLYPASKYTGGLRPVVVCEYAASAMCTRACVYVYAMHAVRAYMPYTHTCVHAHIRARASLDG